MNPVGDRGYELTAKEVARAVTQNQPQFEIFINKAVNHSGDGSTGAQTLIFADGKTTRQFRKFCDGLEPPITVRERGR